MLLYINTLVPCRNLPRHWQIIEVKMSKADTANKNCNHTTHMCDFSNHIAENAEHIHDSNLSYRILWKEVGNLKNFGAN
jgi:hypothetical protein